MRILFLCDYYPPNTQGGHELLASRAARDLRARGHELAVLTSASPLHVDSEAYIRPILKRIKPGGGMLGVYFHGGNLYRASRVLRSFQPDIVVAWGLAGISLACLVPFRLFGVPCLLVQGDAWLKNYINLAPRKGRWVRRKALEYLSRCLLSLYGIRRMVVCSQAHAEVFHRCGFTEERIRVLFPGIDIERFACASERGREDRESPAVIMLAGSLSRAKGVDVALRAAGMLGAKFPGSKLTLLGRVPSDSWTAEFNALLAETRASCCVEILSFLPYEEVPIHLHSHDFLWAPSRTEAFGLTAVEAMASGTLVVAAAVGGLVEIVGSDATGQLFSPGDPAALYEATVRLWNGGAAKRRQLSSEAFVRAQTLFASSRYASGLEEELFGLLEI